MILVSCSACRGVASLVGNELLLFRIGRMLAGVADGDMRFKDVFLCFSGVDGK